MRDFINKHSPDIFLLQETHFLPGSLAPCIPNYVLYRNDRPPKSTGMRVRRKGSGGTAILVKDSVPHHHITTPTLQFAEATVITIEHQGSPLTIISAYFPPRNAFSQKPPLEQDLMALLNLGRRVVVCGDFNARHKSWNCSGVNRYGTMLYDFALKADVIVAAPPDPTHYTRTVSTTIDLAVIKNFPFQRELESISEMSSDHNPVRLTFTHRYVTPETNIPRVNWEVFSQLINDKHLTCYNIYDHEELETYVAQLESHIKTSFELAQKYPPKKTEFSLPLYLRLLKREKNQARRRYQRDKTVTNRRGLWW